MVNEPPLVPTGTKPRLLYSRTATFSGATLRLRASTPSASEVDEPAQQATSEAAPAAGREHAKGHLGHLGGHEAIAGVVGREEAPPCGPGAVAPIVLHDQPSIEGRQVGNVVRQVRRSQGVSDRARL